MLALHDLHKVYTNFNSFKAELNTLLAMDGDLEMAQHCIETLGLIEPISHHYISPDRIQIQASNLRESISASGCVSRNRAVLRVLELVCGSAANIQELSIGLLEGLTGMASWMQRHVPGLTPLNTLVEVLTSARHDPEATAVLASLREQAGDFDVLLLQDRIAGVGNTEVFLADLRGFVREGGRVLATFPMAYGQMASLSRETDSEPILIPGWEILDQARQAGFRQASMHLIAAWKFGILAGTLPGVLVLELER